MKRYILLVIILFMVPNLVSATIPEELNNKVTSYHSFEEVASPAVDKLNILNYTCNAAECPDWQMQGILGYGINFTSTNADQMNSSSDSADLSTGTGNYTICFWARVHAVNETTWAFAQWHDTAYYGFQINDAGRPAAWIAYTNAGVRILVYGAANDVSDTDWHFYCQARNGTSGGTAWMDGATYSDTTLFNGVPVIDNDNHYLGYDETNHFNITLDELSFYNTSLNTAEIQYLYNGGTPTTEQQYPFGVGNISGNETATLTRNVNTLIATCNSSAYSAPGYQYTLFADGVNISSGFAYTRGDTNAMLYSPYSWADQQSNWNATHPASNFIDNNSITFAITNAGSNSIINMTYRVPFYPNVNYTIWGAETGHTNLTYNMTEWSLGEYFSVIGYSYGPVPQRGIFRALNLTSRTYDELIYNVLTSAPENQTAAAFYEDNYTVNYNISSYNRGIAVNVKNYTIDTSVPTNYVLSCRAINLYSINGTSTAWVNSSSLVANTKLNINITNEITQELIDDRNVTIEFINTATGESQTNMTDTGLINYSVSTTGETYVIKYSAEGYHPREYYFTSSSALLRIELVLLNYTGTQIIHTVYDEYGDEVTNVTIHQLRQYGGTYKTVAMTRTNFEGNAVLYAQMYSINYRMIYYSPSGELIRITTPSPFLTTESLDQIVLENDAYWSWKRIGNIFANVSIINNSGTMTARFIYTDGDGILRDGCLVVKRLTSGGVETICNNCTSSASAILTCLINESIEGEYQAYGLIDTNSTNSWYNVGFVTWIRSYPFRFGQEGVFLSFMVVGTLALLGVSTITGSIVLMILGLLIPLVLTMVSGFTISIYLWLAIMGLIILFLIRKVKK